ncbi:MAG TPA: glycerol-3-phosphate 1-O-acyltransferase PlsY [Bacillales bacterium]|nr:glycerol-3-phosphate 1-O-acyltransferase PlsY [Bacillales bacterium]
MDVVLSAVIAYLLGSISFSFLITKLMLKDDIRKHGSGNAGATNTLRVLGTGPAIAVLLLDVLKGVAAVWIAVWLGDGVWALPIAGLMAIVGHNWPVFFNFRGGKGVATTIGVFATLFFLPSIYAGILAILLIILTRYVSLGSLLFVIAAPVFTLFVGSYPISYFIVGLVIAVLSYWRHRSNITRLIAGTENKLGKR